MDHKPLTPEQAKELVMIWKRAAPFLEEQRERDIRGANTVEAMQTLSGCFNMALRDLPPRTSSGLIEMHEWLKRSVDKHSGGKPKKKS